MVVDDDRFAPAGTIWVCPACGRTGKDRYEMDDTSCTTWAVLCFEDRKPGKAVAGSSRRFSACTQYLLNIFYVSPMSLGGGSDGGSSRSPQHLGQGYA
jgi:hypothetical protein